MANINFFALGGQDETGKNCYILEVENDLFIIDSGIKHPVQNDLGIDAIIPNFEYLVLNKERIKGVFITHAHDLNFAALP
jgi:ribonuclease J